jgi:hypothetical protein
MPIDVPPCAGKARHTSLSLYTLHAQSARTFFVTLPLTDVRFVYWSREQAALPQGIVPFVFAKEYGVHPDILSTG